jgi:hypothetical protein
MDNFVVDLVQVADIKMSIYLYVWREMQQIKVK